jgi:hypothetical protein
MLAERIEIWSNEAEHRGMQQGRLEGLAEGESRFLRRQLERRFGALSVEVGERLSRATPGELER